MDGTTSTAPCDSSSSPSTDDVARVTEFYQRGVLSDFTEVDNGNGTATVTWLDHAWADKDHLVWASYRLSEQHDWVSFTYDRTENKVGRHRGMGGWTRHRYIDIVDLRTHQRDNPGARLPDVSQYVLCGQANTAQYGTGQVLCSDLIEVSNADHNNSLATPTPTPLPDPELTIDASNKYPASGETVTLTATLDPHPPGTVTYQWQRHLNGQWSDVSGADSAELRVQSDSRATREYRVVVSYDLGVPVVATSSTLTITWQNAPTSTPTLTATETPTPKPTKTPTPLPTATNTPEPPTATPTPAQSWCELYPDLCCDDEPWHPFCGPYK